MNDKINNTKFPIFLINKNKWNKNWELIMFSTLRLARNEYNFLNTFRYNKTSSLCKRLSLCYSISREY